ncbi:hypothetical protein U1Q18_004197, partial [Sarracenia purpurea var. burkii]
ISKHINEKKIQMIQLEGFNPVLRVKSRLEKTKFGSSKVTLPRNRDRNGKRRRRRRLRRNVQR